MGISEAPWVVVGCDRPPPSCTQKALLGVDPPTQHGTVPLAPKSPKENFDLKNGSPTPHGNVGRPGGARV